MGITVKTFPSYQQVLVKNKVFQVVSSTEMELLTHTNQHLYETTASDYDAQIPV